MTGCSTRSSFNTTICVLEALLEYERAGGGTPEVTAARLRGPLVASKRDGEGRWPLETRYPGVMPVELDDGVGRPSRWNSLRALRVLRWSERAGAYGGDAVDIEPGELGRDALRPLHHWLASRATHSSRSR